MKWLARFAVLFAALIAPAAALDREAFTVTRFRLEAQIDRTSHVIAVTGRITLRNDAKLPQKNLALQVSSSLSWNGIALDRTPVEWIGNNYNTDTDHTGAVSEAIVTLPKQAAPGATITLDVQYGGTVTPAATRFTRIGAPETVALRNDWDQISEPFTAIRGLGHVIWYPVSLPAVSLSEGNTVFEAIRDWKLRHAGTQFDATVRVLSGEAALCIAGNATSQPCGTFGDVPDPRTGAMSTEIVNTIHLDGMGAVEPAFAVAEFKQLERPGIVVFHSGDKLSLARDYAAAAETNDAVLADWLPPPSRPAMVIELGDPNANPFQNGAVLFTPLRQADPGTLGKLLMPTQVATRFVSPRLWIAEGLQRFLQALGVERRAGRKAAIDFLAEYLPPLVGAEAPIDQAPAPTDKSANATAPGDALLNSSDDIVLRGKGSFVFWMLRDMLGNTVLQHAIASYRPFDDKGPGYFQSLLEEGRKRDLEWFFDDWVYRDRGLPEFRVDSVHARPILNDPNHLELVTITVENRGGAGAEVPITVHSAGGERSLRLVIPAHQKAVARQQVAGAPARVVVNDGSIPTSRSKESGYDVPATSAPN